MGSATGEAELEAFRKGVAQGLGTLALVEVTRERFVIDAVLTLIDPELDLDHVGSHQLVGVIVIAR